MKNQSIMLKSARTRLAGLLDAGSFMETGVFVQNAAAAETVVTGYGSINERPVCVYTYDAASFGGAMGEMHAQKVMNVYDMAFKCGNPVIALVDTAGAELQEGVDSLNAYAALIHKVAALSGVVPQITVLMGTATGAAAIMAQLADIVIAVDEPTLSALTPPSILEATCGEAFGDAKSLMETGCVHLLCPNEPHALETARLVFDYLPSNNLEDSPLFDEESAEMLIQDTTASVALDIISSISDINSVLELNKGYADAMITALARVNGISVGFVANDKLFMTSQACEKATRFIRMCDAFGLPVITLTNCDGFEVSVEAEKAGFMKSAARLMYAYCEATVPLISVIVGNAVGSVYTCMGARGLGQDMVFAWAQASISTTDAEDAENLLWEAARHGYVDDVIQPADTRKRLIGAIEMLISKSDSRPQKKHDNMPL